MKTPYLKNWDELTYAFIHLRKKPDIESVDSLKTKTRLGFFGVTAILS